MRALLAVLATLLASVSVHSTPALERLTVTVEGLAREALVAAPTRPSPAGAPLVLVFHGHGGTARHAAQSMPIQDHWPEAVVVFPQGLPTPGQITDPDGRRAGWQPATGDQGDRDLKFVDALLAELQRRYRIDPQRRYATGHSNGGGFTYLLWATRADTFAAFAPSSAILSIKERLKTPRPVLHLASPQDPLVKFAWQEKQLAFIARLNGTGPLNLSPGYRSAPGRNGNDVAVFIHDGGHGYPTQEAPKFIVAFFQAHPAKP